MAGENDCSGSYIDPLMSWLDSEDAGYLAWDWNADFNCSSGPGLITDYTSDATAYGAAHKAHISALAASDGGSSTGGTGGGGATAGTAAEIRAVGAGKCLDVPNVSQAEGTQVDISDCDGGADQSAVTWAANHPVLRLADGMIGRPRWLAVRSLPRGWPIGRSSAVNHGHLRAPVVDLNLDRGSAGHRPR